MSWLDEYRRDPSRPRPSPPAAECGEPHFHGGMSDHCLFEAGRRGRNALMAYLTLWHYVLPKPSPLAVKIHGKRWLTLSREVAESAGLSHGQFRAGLGRLLADQRLAEEQQSGRGYVACPLDPWPPGETLYFKGFMSFRCFRVAAQCSKGSALLVYILAHHRFNLSRKAEPVRLGPHAFGAAGVKRSSGHRAIDALAKAGLLEIHGRCAGRVSVVTPIDPWSPDRWRAIAAGTRGPS